MLVRFTNALLLLLVVLLTVTGLYGLVWSLQGWSFDLHRASAWAFVALIPWKALISARSLRRGLRFDLDRGLIVAISLVLSAASLLVVGLGAAWTWSLAQAALWPGYSPLTIHWVLGLALVPPVALHAWRRWPRPKRSEFLSRRGALRFLGLALAGVAGWQASRALGAGREDPAHRARLTGSREQGSGGGNRFPVTTNPGHAQAPVDAGSWRLSLRGALERPLTLAYDDLLALPPAEVTAALDCTVGWYSVQIWRGVPLADLLRFARVRPSARWVRLLALSGYAQTFNLVDATEILLATHVGGDVLADAHGYPLRAVVPSRRGWFWVKWVAAIEALDRPPG